MKKLYLVGTILLFATCYCLAEETKTQGDHQDNHTADGSATATLGAASHSLGLFYGQRASNNFDDINYDQFMKGFQTAFENEPDQETQKQASTIVETYMQERHTAKAATSLKKSTVYLQENAKKEGIQVTESGLQYEVLKEGKGKQPQASDWVTVHYRGTLMDGTEFDSSYSRNKPSSFQLSNVIKGWTEGLQLMREGANYKFTIPPELAYGERGAGSTIGPNEALVFEVELIKVETREQTTQPAKDE